MSSLDPAFFSERDFCDKVPSRLKEAVSDMSNDISFRHIIVTDRRPLTLCHRHNKGTNPLSDYGLNRLRLHLYL
jgi:hypothetical protein